MSRARGPPACDAMLVGTSLSLSGRFRRQGDQARDGLQLWVEYARDAGQRPVPRLIVLDDESRASVAQAHARRLLAEHQVDVLVGPYSSGLVRAVAPIADAAGKVLWNHGGTSDAILQAGARRVVSVASPASDYLRSLPAWGRRRVPVVNRVMVLHAASGTFASEVARGAAEGARAAGCVDVRVVPFESPLLDASALCRKAAMWDPDLVVSVGTFEDDLAVARERATLPERTVLRSSPPASPRSATSWAPSPRASSDRASGSRRPVTRPSWGPTRTRSLAPSKRPFIDRPSIPRPRRLPSG